MIAFSLRPHLRAVPRSFIRQRPYREGEGLKLAAEKNRATEKT